MAKKSKVNVVEEQVSTETGRVYKQNVLIDSDLFKLQTAAANKNVAWGGDVQLEPVDHNHFFHTYDSDGRRQSRSTPVAGHFHEIDWADGEPGEPSRIVSISGPMRLMKVKEKGRFKMKAVPVAEELEDNHTHKIAYIKSDSVEARQVNPRAVQMLGEEAMKTNPLPGVQS